MAGRIEDYGLIGDLQTVALVSRDGCIDWPCFPRFDSGAIFASLLGTEENGHWTIQPAGEFRSPSRRYRGDTLVLETDFETESGRARLIDFMPPRGEAPDVVRIVEGVAGEVDMRHGARPALRLRRRSSRGYAASTAQLVARRGPGRGLRCGLRSSSKGGTCARTPSSGSARASAFRSC